MLSYCAVVLYFRLGEQIETTLAALHRQTHPPTEIVVVDNASGDGILDMLVSQGRILPNVRVVALGENVGYSGGMNRGVEALRDQVAPNVLLLTHEVELAPTAGEHLARLVGNAAAVGPTLQLQDGTVWSTGGYLTRTGRPAHRSDSIRGASRRVDWLDGACVMASRAAITRIGGLDESYFLYWEDVDFGTRLNRIAPVLCSAQAFATQDTASAPIYFDSRNRLRYWRKQRRLNLVALSVLELAAKLILRDFPQGGRPQAKARLMGIRDGLGRGSSARMIFARESR